MLRTLAKSVLAGAIGKETGVSQAGPIAATLLTTGASLLLVRGRRPIGLALIAAGGLLRWQEIERERRAAAAMVRKPPRSRDISGATPPR